MNSTETTEAIRTDFCYYLQSSLDLGGLATVLPENDVGGNAVLTPVNKRNHGLRVHRLAGEELVILEAANDLLDVGSGTLLEGRKLVRVVLLEVLLDRLHIALDVGEVGLLVERGLLKTSVVNNVVDLEGLSIVSLVVSALSTGVSTDVDIRTRLDLNHSSIDLVDDTVDLLDIKSIGKELVVRENIFVNQHGDACGQRKKNLGTH